MPGKKGTSRAPDGSYIPTEEAKKLWAECATPKKKNKKVEEVETTEILGTGDQRKLTTGKRGDTKKYPRVTITEYDEKGRKRYTTFVCDPASLSINKSERIDYTASGKAKSALWLTLETDVLEIE